MKSKIKIALLIATCCIILLSIFFISNKLDEKGNSIKSTQILPKFSVCSIDSSFNITPQTLSKYKTKYILFFNSDCDHCQHEIKSVCSNFKRFENSIFLLISNEKISVLRKFQLDYKLEKLPIFIASDEKLQVNKIFDSFFSPTTFVYDQNNKLIRKIVGEVGIDYLIKISQ